MPLEMRVDARSGTVTVAYTKNGDRKTVRKHLDLPPDLANGLVPTLLKNVDPARPPKSLPLVVATPREPRLISLSLEAAIRRRIAAGGARRAAFEFTLVPQIGGVEGWLAPLVGKTAAERARLDPRGRCASLSGGRAAVLRQRPCVAHRAGRPPGARRHASRLTGAGPRSPGSGALCPLGSPWLGAESPGARPDAVTKRPPAALLGVRYLRVVAVLLLLLVAGLAIGFALLRSHGLVADRTPGAFETAIARRLVVLSIPASARGRVNPNPADGAAWRHGSEHFQEHCAICHGVDGRGGSDIARRITRQYPISPIPPFSG